MENVMNNPIMYIMAIIVFAVLVMVGVLWMLPRLIKRGVDVSGIVDKANITLTALDTMADMIGKLFPNAPMGIVDKVLNYAMEAVLAAEQMYKASQIPGEERKQTAAELVYKFLEAAGVEVNEDMKRIVDGAIEAAVYGLPKTHREERTESADAAEE